MAERSIPCVAANFNNRAVEYDAPLSPDTNAARTADRVFGQLDLFSGAPNHGELTANSLTLPYGVTVDAQGNLYVADSGHNRVLEYDAPLSSSMAANRVFGQAHLTSGDCNSGGVSAARLCSPQGVPVDAQGNLFVADDYNHRVLEFDLAPVYRLDLLLVLR